MSGLTFCFGIIAIPGIFYLLISLVSGGITEGAGDVVEGVDNLLEGLGVDIIPDVDGLGDGYTGISLGTIAVALAIFGIFGLLASLTGVSPPVNIALALLYSIFIGGIYFLLMLILLRQQRDSLIFVDDFVGLVGRTTIPSSSGEVGQGFFVIKGRNKTYPIIEVNKLSLERNDAIKIVHLKAGRLYVEKIERQSDKKETVS